MERISVFGREDYMFQELSQEDYGNLSREDICLKAAFGRYDPQLASHPHCIFVPTAVRLRIVAGAIGDKVGLFGGIAPLVQADGKGYAPPDEGVIDDFVFWEIEKNQNYLYEYYYAGADNAPFLISTRTPPALLRRMIAVGSCEGSFPYGIYIERVGDWIDELGWAYVRLVWTGEFAMFVTAHRHADWVERVKKEIGPAAFSLIRDGDRWRWPPIHEDPQNRSSRVERRKHGWEPER